MGKRSLWMLASRSLIAVAFVGVCAPQAVAQSGGHAEHHPGTTAGTPDAPPTSAPATPTAPPSNPPAGVSSTQPPMPGMGSGGPGMGGGMGAGGAMGGMMGEMMGRPRKEFYPSLMDVPALTAEQRQSLEAQARIQISAGTDGRVSMSGWRRCMRAAMSRLVHLPGRQRRSGVQWASGLDPGSAFGRPGK